MQLLNKEQLQHLIENISYSRPDSKTIVADLLHKNPNNEHPRLYARADDFVKIRELLKTNDFVRSWYIPYKNAADLLIGLPPLEFELRDGTRLLHTSKDVTDRVQALAIAYQIEQDAKYAKRAYLELQAVSEFPHWNPKHFLDVGQMMHAFSIGYDWIYNGMDDEQRAVVRNAIIKHGLNEYIKAYKNFDSGKKMVAGKDAGWWTVTTGNWNPWCNSGAILASLAIGDEEMALAGHIVERALRSLERALPSYAPDGGCDEGIGYGVGATGFVVKLVAGMDSALGTDYGYFEDSGYCGFSYFLLYMTGTNTSFNFHDSGDNSKLYLSSDFFIANKLDDPALGSMRKRDIERKKTRGELFDILWYKPERYERGDKTLSLDRCFRKVETGSFRSSWEDDEAIWLAFHGGENNVGHTHLDAGTFVFDAMGLNWAMDLGTEKLTYFGTKEQMGNHLLLYRLAPDGHNTLVINPSATEEGQAIPAWNPVIDFVSKPNGAFAKMDITAAYSAQADGDVWDLHSILVGEPRRQYKTKVHSAVRGFALTENRTKIIIQDELDLVEPSDVWWSIHTPAAIVVSEDGRNAILTQQGKKMRASLLSPENGKLLAMKAEPLPDGPQNNYQTVNDGIQKLAVKVAGNGKMNIAIEFICIHHSDDFSKAVGKFVPLCKWSI